MGGPSNLKNEAIFSYVLGTLYANFQQFPIKWSYGRNCQTKISTFIVVKSGNLCLRIPPEAPFYWKFLRIGIQRAKDMRKDGLIFQVWGSALATPTPPVFRGVLYHTEPSGQTLLGRSVPLNLIYISCLKNLNKSWKYSKLLAKWLIRSHFTRTYGIGNFKKNHWITRVGHAFDWLNRRKIRLCCLKITRMLPISSECVRRFFSIKPYFCIGVTSSESNWAWNCAYPC